MDLGLCVLLGNQFGYSDRETQNNIGLNKEVYFSLTYKVWVGVSASALTILLASLPQRRGKK